jgi:Kef-type K+ transport system membrane component KefB
VEGGKSKTPVGALVLCACFITDLSASIALCVLFVTPGPYLLLLIGALVALVFFGPRMVDWCFRTLKGRSGEPEVKVVLLLVMMLAAFASLAGVSAVLPAYVLGLIMSRSLAKDPQAVLHMRTALMAFLGSFFFISAGTNVQLSAVYIGIVPLLVLFAVRLVSKLAAVGLVGRKCVVGPVHYISWLMATALSFGVIFAQAGLSSNLISSDQFSILVMVIVMSAVIPTLVAQRCFDPWGEKNGQ